MRTATMTNEQRKEKTAWLVCRWAALNKVENKNEKGLELQRRIECELLKINEPFMRGNIRLPPAHVDRPDVLNLFRIGMVEALSTFKETGGASFLTWWAFYLQKALMEWRKWLKESNRLIGGGMETGMMDGLMLEAGKRGWPAGGAHLEKDEAGDCESMIDRFSSGGDGRSWRIMKWKFVDGLNLREIGDRLGISRERVRQVIEDEIEKMRKGRRSGGY